ncbi:MAG: metalloregulator ArsR/SmtB family transcription factor [Candidatus Bipolaricaulota bacterium]
MGGRIEGLARAFAALGSPERLQIVGLLLDDEQPNCGDIACRLGLSAPSVSYHLRALESAGLIRRVRRGQRRCVLLTPRLKELVRPEMLRPLKEGGS